MSLKDKCYQAAADLGTWRRRGFSPFSMGICPLSVEGNLCAKEGTSVPWRGTSVPRRCQARAGGADSGQPRGSVWVPGSWEQGAASVGRVVMMLRGGGEKLPHHLPGVGNTPRISQDQSPASPALSDLHIQKILLDFIF